MVRPEGCATLSFSFESLHHVNSAFPSGGQNDSDLQTQPHDIGPTLACRAENDLDVRWFVLACFHKSALPALREI
jgi:hypothetical protein